ncbi:hypothetical protein M406DRAFT_66253 [Cryphonectria parasitica EP155]|uniref:Uncharacterized protein n=1 Tax=Cryphonectria parasitica (strain ATCC 38755 / EP155) TaxID=660469 RepID=A0A9P4YBT4_CRYP1|nr:uncharacterized protein M406DRAFT_66253 [Cryphonectria parasitica EP155]KAF3769785.1 hypothetical protein M406DRAFT_66253 [Cryphonectria parasitica EP155]
MGRTDQTPRGMTSDNFATSFNKGWFTIRGALMAIVGLIIQGGFLPVALTADWMQMPQMPADNNDNPSQPSAATPHGTDDKNMPSTIWTDLNITQDPTITNFLSFNSHAEVNSWAEDYTGELTAAGTASSAIERSDDPADYMTLTAASIVRTETLARENFKDIGTLQAISKVTADRV